MAKTDKRKGTGNFAMSGTKRTNATHGVAGAIRAKEEGGIAVANCVTLTDGSLLRVLLSLCKIFFVHLPFFLPVNPSQKRGERPLCLLLPTAVLVN